jgi:hypothetical protein
MTPDEARESCQSLKLQTQILSGLSEMGNRLSNIRVHIEGNSITLSGIVRSYYDRQLCISNCRRISNFIDIKDQLEVMDR